MCSYTTLPARRRAVGVARKFVRDTLEGRASSAEIEDAELIVSELATNAVEYDGPTMTICVCVEAGQIQLGVSDADSDRGAGAPHVIAASDSAESGRGLAIVKALANSWGVTPTDHGKRVWVVLQS